MSAYQIDQTTFSREDSHADSLLARAHAGKKRPLCLCKRPPIPMYIAKVAERFHLKRMPDTGPLHAPSCASYEPPAELSGLGEVVGAAIQEDPDDGTTALRLDFALTKTGKRAAPVAAGVEHGSARTDGKKLTLQGLLHYLWDQAGFNRWSPAMQGKRSWATVHKYLLEAALHKHAKGAALGNSLFVPEPFNSENKVAIARRRAATLAPLSTATKGTRKLMLLLGEVKSIEQSRYDFKLTVKHLPDYPFLVNTDLRRRLYARFESEVTLWDFDATGHLLIMATFGLTSSGVAQIEEAALMHVNTQWLPCESVDELNLLRALVDGQRHFSKGLRYNLGSGRPLASAVTHDTQPLPVALYVLPQEIPTGYASALADLVANSTLANWYWHPSEPCPDLPPIDGYISADLPDLSAPAPDDDAA